MSFISDPLREFVRDSYHQPTAEATNCVECRAPWPCEGSILVDQVRALLDDHEMAIAVTLAAADLVVAKDQERRDSRLRILKQALFDWEANHA